jgi:hypothetical protein
MLDWTTSFLSDALIIKPEIAVCQTLSQAIQRMGIGRQRDYNRWILGGRRYPDAYGFGKVGVQ